VSHSTNKRKIFYEKKIKQIFSGYLIFTLVLVLVLLGNLFTKTFFSVFTPGFTENATGLGPGVQLGIFILWMVCGFFFSYIYASSRVHGILFRLGRVCEQVASGESKKIGFRKADPFHEVAVSMNKVIEKIHLLNAVKEELGRISKQAEPATRAKIEEVLKKI
jgi:hypothetical protein